MFEKAAKLKLRFSSPNGERAKIMEFLSRKQDQAMEQKTVEELQQMLAEQQ